MDIVSLDYLVWADILDTLYFSKLTKFIVSVSFSGAFHIRLGAHIVPSKTNTQIRVLDISLGFSSLSPGFAIPRSELLLYLWLALSVA